MFCALSGVVARPAFAETDVERLPSGLPDFSGTYDTSTLTPLTRPAGPRTLPGFVAEFLAERVVGSLDELSEDLDANRGLPPKGGEKRLFNAARMLWPDRLPEEDRRLSRSGEIGAYDSVWTDMGDEATRIGGEYRTAIVVDPANGRLPPLTPQAEARLAKRDALYGSLEDDGTAWWGDDAGPFDDPELRPLADRCLAGLSSSTGPPLLPSFYNNFRRIVQTPTHIMILAEMVHDARIVRMDGEHAESAMRRWLGDSIGWWEGDTLVVETINFNDTPPLGHGATRHLRVLERFTPLDGSTVLYRFTVEDPATWTQPWSGEYVWRRTDQALHEYACHEGNYSMGNILCGARRLEAEAAGEAALAAFARSPCGIRAGLAGGAP